MGNSRHLARARLFPKESRIARPTAAASPFWSPILTGASKRLQETRARLAALEEDWDAPGMEAYDHL